MWGAAGIRHRTKHNLGDDWGVSLKDMKVLISSRVSRALLNITKYRRIDMTHEHQHLAALVYASAIEKQIEERVEAKYSKRIDHLVNVSNELMNELEQCESELVTVEKECYGRGV